MNTRMIGRARGAHAAPPGPGRATLLLPGEEDETSDGPRLVRGRH
ncbi:hypothetical protein [Streptomyces alfalfae]